MKSISIAAALALASASSVSAFTIVFHNNCGQTVWPAVGQAPYGSPQPNGVKFGTKLSPGQSASFGVDDHQIGIRAWGRTGCNSNGGSCATGNCVGGLVCTDAGITSGVILSEYGYANFGQYGGDRTSWDLSHVNSAINLNTRLSVSDGQSVQCTTSNCPTDQAYNVASDSAADRNSGLGQTFTHTFCP